METNTTAKRWKGVIDAVKHNDFEAVKFWVEEKGVNLAKKNAKKQTAAHLAAVKDNIDILKYLLQHDRSTKVKKSLHRLKDGDGLTIFHIAAQKGAINSMRYLVDESGIDIDLYDPVSSHPKNNALHLAAENGCVEVLRYLIEEKQADVNAPNKLHESPIFVATGNSQFDTVKFLIERCKADPTIVDWMRNNILHRAAATGDLSVLRYLLDDLKVAFDVNARNDLGDTPLNLATKFNHTHSVEYFVEEKKADVNIPDLQYRSPLYQAAFYGYFDLVKYLAEHGADTELRDEAGYRPLDAATGSDVKKYLKARSSRLRNRRSIVAVSENPEPLPYTLGQRTKMTDRKSDLFLSRSGKLDRYGTAVVAPPSSSDLDSFLVLADLCVRYFTNVLSFNNHCNDSLG